MVSIIDYLKKLHSMKNIDNDEMLGDEKIKMLLYYIQGYHIAVFNRPIIEFVIKATSDGVDIDLIKLDDIILNEEVERLIEQVFELFGCYTEWKLREKITQEKPWIEARAGGNILSNQVMSSYFQNFIE